MGNLLSEQIFIVGEVDYHDIPLGQPFWSTYNLCLRYPTISATIKPLIVTVNYYTPVNCKYLFVSNIEQVRNGCQLRLEGKTTIVMVECHRNLVTGSFSGCRIIASEIVPITKLYCSEKIKREPST